MSDYFFRKKEAITVYTWKTVVIVETIQAIHQKTLYAVVCKGALQYFVKSNNDITQFSGIIDP